MCTYPLYIPSEYYGDLAGDVLGELSLRIVLRTLESARSPGKGWNRKVLRDPRDGEYIERHIQDVASTAYFKNRSSVSEIIEEADREMEQACSFISDLSDKAQLPPRRRVLEVGCGNGATAVACAAAGHQVIATDYSAARIGMTTARIRDHQVNATASIADATCLPIASCSQDLVICKNVYEHVRKPTVMLSEIRRVLVTGGHCYLSVPNRYALQQLIRDEHYNLPGLVLLPKSLAKLYAVDIMKRDKYYIVERVPAYWELCREFRRYFFSYMILSPDLQLVRQKVMCPETVHHAKLRSLSIALNRLRLSRIVSSLITNDLSLSLLYPHISFLLTKTDSDTVES